MVRHIISMLDVEEDLNEILELATVIKARQKNGEIYEPLKNKSLGMIFEKSSTRTRVSFEVGMTQLGGHALYLSPKDLQIGRGETIPDTARVLSRYVDAIMYRAFSNKVMKELAGNATVPVINGLDDIEHPCQILADLLTIKEHKGNFEGLKMVYVGDGNNVCNSLLLGAAMTKMNMVVACPKGYEPDQELFRKAQEIAVANGCTVAIEYDPAKAVEGADIIYTDVWISMGQEGPEAEAKERTFRPYQVNEQLVSHAKPDYIFMHCLPAHRGYEVTDGVVDSPNSVVLDEAENRLHAQKAVMQILMA
ncbi:MAG: ornithine carbamoyltransferase [Candidatus Thermoplasmatota archaeon]|nr:ornithine carbamoyltransferase [Candidatus Thermoplasmatota archaeon]